MMNKWFLSDHLFFPMMILISGAVLVVVTCGLRLIRLPEPFIFRLKTVWEYSAIERRFVKSGLLLICLGFIYFLIVSVLFSV
jgi:hypothetical protein